MTPPRRLWTLVALALSCSKDADGDSDNADESSTAESGIDPTNADDGPKLDLPGNDTEGGGCGGDGSCSSRVDLLFIIDNSGSMSEEQLNLALNMPSLVQGLDALVDIDGNPLNPDVNIMVTTTDVGNPLCEPYYKPGRSPELGAPIASPCTDRIERFTGIGMDPVVADSACTDVCPSPIAPDDDFINFQNGVTNVPDAAPIDVNGDGTDDNNIAQALACIGPQGIDGCGYESQLEAMRKALDPDAEWNTGATPFLRDGGLLAVAIITDEVDCSLADESVMSDDAFMETHPETMQDVPSSAICWNAGVTCDGPDANGVYSDCHSSGEGLVAVQEYIDFLDGQGRPVVMLGIIGVPIVTERNPEAPYQPLAGGLDDLVYRTWKDPEYPAGDILPDDWADGVTAAHQEWQYGIGPGCTGEDGNGGFTGQATPPTRIIEVCQALDVSDDPGTPMNEAQIRCCIESICDTSFASALRCLTGLVAENTIPPA